MRITALGYKAGSGKDTAAAMLLEEYGTIDAVMQLAAPVKDATMRLFGLSLAQVQGTEKNTVDPRWGCTPRSILQKLASGMRRDFGQDILVRILLERARALKYTNIVIADVRAWAEAEALKAAGAKLVQITGRAYELPASDAQHHTEHELEGYAWNAAIVNDAGLAALRMRTIIVYGFLYPEAT